MSIDQFLLSATTTDLNYPEVRPTLDLNFARTKTLDPRITFTRASGGSYVGADGLIKYAGVNEARFDHNPDTGESLGLLIEESRSNLSRRSESLNEYNNIRLSSTTITTGGPTGTGYNEKITTSLGSDYIFHNTNPISVTAGQTVTFSIFFKSITIPEDDIYLRFWTGTDRAWTTQRQVRYNLSRLTAVDSTGTIINKTIQKFSDGWYRLSMTASADQNGELAESVVVVPNAVRQIFQVFGAQVELGTFPTSYIPTVGSTRTRSADRASIVDNNFSSFYSQLESTIFFSGRTLATPNVAKLFGGLADSRIGFLSSLYFNVGSNPVVVAWSPLTGISSLGNYTSNKEVKGILGYTTAEPTASACVNDEPVRNIFNRSLSFEGNTIFGFPKTINRLTIGSSPWSFDSPLNGTVSRVTYFPKRLPNAQLQALTR
jgi:hypothetical protein